MDRLRQKLKKNGGKFFESYWFLMGKRIQLLRWILGKEELLKYDYQRLYRQSLFYQWQIISLMEFMDEIKLRGWYGEEVMETNPGRETEGTIPSI